MSSAARAPGASRSHLASLGQGQGELEVFVACRYALHFRVSCFRAINKDSPHPQRLEEEDGMLPTSVGNTELEKTSRVW